MFKYPAPFNKYVSIKAAAVLRKVPTILYIIKWFFISIIIAFCVGSVSSLFLISLDKITLFRESHSYIILLLPLGGVIIALIYYHFGKGIEDGNNVIIDGIYNTNKSIPLKIAPFVYLGTIITHLFGGSSGREGTAIHMAGAIISQFSKIFKIYDSERKVLIISAIAAGFGSVFGTPLAGAIFALEVVLIGNIRYNAIFPAFAASILAVWVTHLWGVSYEHYVIEAEITFGLLTIIYSVLAGIIFGICSALFSKMMHLCTRLFANKIKNPLLRPIVGGIIIIIAIFLFGRNYIGLGLGTISESFSVQMPFYVFALKVAFTILTLSCGFKGGEVTPLFFIGATLGSALTIIMPLPIALLAAMGFTAVLAGATNTPLACIVLGLEIFDIEFSVYITIACVVSYLVSGHNSIYVKQRVGEAKHTLFSRDNGKSISDIK